MPTRWDYPPPSLPPPANALGRHAIQAFNRGLFDIFIATDDPKLMQGRASASFGEVPAAQQQQEGGKKRRKKRGAKREGPSAADAEFGVARGVDFCEVTAVVNLDLPPSVEVYKRGSRSWRRADA